MTEREELREVCATLRGVLDRLDNQGQPFLLTSTTDHQQSEYVQHRRADDVPLVTALTDEQLRKLVTAEIRHRNIRLRLLDEVCDTRGKAFHAPGWDILLDLYAHALEGRRVSITSSCIASGVPPTTALRYLQVLEEAGLIERVDDRVDRRRSFLSLTSETRNLMRQYFELSHDLHRPR